MTRELSWGERFAGFELGARCRTRLNHLESVYTRHNTLLLAVHKQECYQKLSAISIFTLRSTINSSQQRLCQRENLNILIPHNERTAAASSSAYYFVSDLLSQNGHVDKHWPTFTFFISDLIHWKQQQRNQRSFIRVQLTNLKLLCDCWSNGCEYRSHQLKKLKLCWKLKEGGKEEQKDL